MTLPDKPINGAMRDHKRSHVGERRIGLGCMALTGIYGRVERSDAIDVIHRALDLGINHFDTAELYGPYANEELLAEALGSRRLDVQVATKFGYKLEGARIVGLDSRPSSIRRAVEGSLRRLRLERIDLLYQHRVDPNVPIEDVIGTMADLVTEGKVAALGLSAIDDAMLKRAQTVHAIAAVQNEYSLIQRQAEVALLPTLERQTTSFVAFSPLGRGIISGNLVASSDRDPADYRLSDVRFAPDRSSTIVTQLQPLWKIAQQREVPPAVVALAWLLAKSPKVSVIPGARSPNQVGISMQAAVFRLSTEEYEHLDGINTVEPKSRLQNQ